MSTPPRYVRTHPLAVARSADGALYVMPLPDGPPRVLNGAAEAIWEVAVSGSTDVVHELAEAFDVPADSIADDVEATLASFVDLGLLEPAPGRTET